MEGWDPVRAGQSTVLSTDKFAWGLLTGVKVEVFTAHRAGFLVHTYTHTPKIRSTNLSSRIQILELFLFISKNAKVLQLL